MLAVILLGLGVSGYARADDTKVTTFLANHGISQIAQAAGCANKCELAASAGGASCDLATATGSTCIPVGTGCTCMGQSVSAGMGLVAGTAVRK
jgi:hypothetical protein